MKRDSMCLWLGFAALTLSGSAAAQVVTPHPILFVTQMPIPSDFATIGSVFANHNADLDSVGRGGDLHRHLCLLG